MDLVTPNDEAVGRVAWLECDVWRWWSTIFGEAFVAGLAPHHREAIEWHWTARMMQRAGQEAEFDTYFAIWSRRHLKSTLARRIAVCDAAVFAPSYVLYIGGTKEKVEGHASSIETLLTAEPVQQWYPKLSRVKRNVQGNSKGWTQEFIHTEQGSVFHFVSLDQGIRGANRDDIRPTIIIPDDIDEPNDSPAVAKKRLRTLTRGILPTRQQGTLHLFAQNLIHEHSVMNQIFSGKERALTRRLPTKPIPALIGMSTEFGMVQGTGRDMIIAGTPTWEPYDLAACQQEVDAIGLPAFQAECQHDLTTDHTGRVIPEYDERCHVIGWSQFKAIFGVEHIPAHWERSLGHDVGYTPEHLSAFTWIATSAANSKLPGKVFRYRGMTFLEKTVDEMAPAVKAAMAADPVHGRTFDELPFLKEMRMSHEKKGERLTYRNKYGLMFKTCDSGKEAGVPQWRHLLKRDRKRPHPFHPDQLGADGLYELGEPGWFDVVDDDQVEAPRDDRGLMLHRDQVLSWKWAPTPLKDSGVADEHPVKAYEDTVDSTRMLTATFGPIEAPKTAEERREEKLPATMQLATIEQLPEDEVARAHETREYWLTKLKAQERASQAKRPQSFINRTSLTGRRK